MGGALPFWDLKTTAVTKGCKQLQARGAIGLQDKPVEQWLLWLDRACVRQGDAQAVAHATAMFSTYIERASGIVILLSPEYFTRLWCVYEYSFFLARRDLSEAAVYFYAFGRQDVISVFLESVRGLSVATLNCSVEED